MKTMEILRATFKPEFLNRIDDIIIFRSLTMADIDRIISIQIGLLQKRLEDRKLFLELTERAKKYISEQGYSPVYGARPLKRAIQKLLLDNLSLKLLEGAFVEGDSILADIDDRGGIVFSRKADH